MSLCVIAKDEEKNLPSCLEHAGLFDEVVVTDTGSADRTREVARSLGARVFEFPWVDSFAAARNACLGHATGEWIFWLDADDRLDAENAGRLGELFARLPAENVAYSMKCRCLAAPGQGAATVVDHVRLFRNDPRIRWRYRIHEQILGSIRDAGGRVEFADVTVTHTGYAAPSLRGRKTARDLRLLEMEYAEQPGDPFTLFNLGMTVADLGQHGRASALLEESLRLSHPRDSIVRKLYVLLSGCQAAQGMPELALHTCLRGQEVCPGDPELLFREGLLRCEAGDLHGAKAAYLRLLEGPREGAYFGSVVDGLRGHVGRHQLAGVCGRLGELAEAESLWLQALRERPDFVHALDALAGLYLHLGRTDQAMPLLERLEALPPEGPQLAARLHERAR